MARDVNTAFKFHFRRQMLAMTTIKPQTNNRTWIFSLLPFHYCQNCYSNPKSDFTETFSLRDGAVHSNFRTQTAVALTSLLWVFRLSISLHRTAAEAWRREVRATGQSKASSAILLPGTVAEGGKFRELDSDTDLRLCWSGSVKQPVAVRIVDVGDNK